MDFKVIITKRGDRVIEIISEVGGVVETGVVGGDEYKKAEHVSYIMLTREQAVELVDKMICAELEDAGISATEDRPAALPRMWRPGVN